MTQVQPTTLSWCTEPPRNNRYFALTDLRLPQSSGCCLEEVVTRSGEPREPLGQEGAGALAAHHPTFWDAGTDACAEEEGAFDLILAELDTTFRYNEDVEMPRALERFFYGLNRKPDQTLLSYVADHREALAEVEKHGVQISDKVSGWILLRRSALSSEQKQLIQSQCPKLSYDKDSYRIPMDS
eukprot:s109_g56.t1